jgi:hypothetical protein
MKKKNIFLAILCTSILLLVPLTNISGASVSGLNTEAEFVEEANTVIPYHLFEELIVLINRLLIDYGDIPEVVVACNEALEAIDSIIQMDNIEEICDRLWGIGYAFGLIGLIALFFLIGEEDLFDALYLIGWIIACFSIVIIIECIGFLLKCDWPPELNQKINKLKDIIDLFPQINLENITEYDITKLQELIKSYEVNSCPCMQV